MAEITVKCLKTARWAVPNKPAEPQVELVEGSTIDLDEDLANYLIERGAVESIFSKVEKPKTEPKVKAKAPAKKSWNKKAD